MSYTSLSFPVFIAAFFLLYYLLPKKYQKWVLLAGNYVFYMWWRPAFGALILAGTLISYWAALAYSKGALGRKKLWITLGVCYNLGVLFVFKYLDFFCSTFARVLGLNYGHEIHLQNRRSCAGLHHYGHRLQSQADEGRRDRRGRFRRG